MSNSRLDRLVQLIQSGSNPQIKQTACQQLGEIIHNRPQDISLLLEKVSKLLQSKDEKTRKACGMGLQEMAKNLPEWQPEHSIVVVKELKQKNLLLFKNFNLLNVLENGSTLLASSGSDFDFQMKGADAKERLEAQRKELAKNFGFDSSEDQQEILKEEDLISVEPQFTDTVAQTNVAEQIGLSSREKASLKRKQKLLKQNSQNVIMNDSENKITWLRDLETIQDKMNEFENRIELIIKSKEPKLDETEKNNGTIKTQIASSSDNQIVLESNTDQTNNNISADHNEWAFQPLLDRLTVDLFDPKWEIRHGAAIGLRDLIEINSQYFGKTTTLCIDHTQLMNDFETLNISKKVLDSSKPTLLLEPKDFERLKALILKRQQQEYFQDLIIRLICIFALDRFMDFDGDIIVVPVRETCAQVLGLAVASLNSEDEEEIIWNIIHSLLLLTKAKIGSDLSLQQQMRTKAMLKYSCAVGFKYVLASRKYFASKVLKNEESLTFLMNGLQDSDDDIRSAASSTLAPISDILIESLNEKKLNVILESLWDSLLDLDDLSTSTSSVMDLLSKLLEHGKFKISPELIPRLFPFFRHNSSVVRRTLLKTIERFLVLVFSQAEKKKDDYKWFPQLIDLLLQNFLIEHNKGLLDLTFQIWKWLIASLTKQEHPLIVSALFKVWTLEQKSLEKWFHLVKTPPQHLLDVFYMPVFGSRYYKALLTEQQSKPKFEYHELNLAPSDLAMLQNDYEVYSADHWWQCRLYSAKALGQLFSLVICKGMSLPDGMGNLLFQTFWNFICSLFDSSSGSVYVYHAKYFGFFLEEVCDALHEQFQSQIPHMEKTFKSLALLMSNTQDGNSIMPSLIKNLLFQFHQQIYPILYKPTQNLTFKEFLPELSALRSVCLAFLNTIFSFCQSLDPQILPPVPAVGQGFQIETALMILEQWVPLLQQNYIQPFISQLPSNEKNRKLIEKFQNDLNGRLLEMNEAIGKTKKQFSTLESLYSVPFANSLTLLGNFLDPVDTVRPKLNPIIKSMMQGIKSETIEFLLQRNAKILAQFIILLNNEQTFIPLDSSTMALGEKERETNIKVTEKLIKNLFNYLISIEKEVFIISDYMTEQDRVLSIQQSVSLSKSESKDSLLNDNDEFKEVTQQEMIETGRKGAEIVFSFLLGHYQENVFDYFPFLWKLISNGIITPISTIEEETHLKFKELQSSQMTQFQNQLWTILRVKEGSLKSLQESLFGLYTLIAYFNQQTLTFVLEHIFQPILLYLSSPWSSIRCMCAKVIAGFVKNSLQLKFEDVSLMQIIIIQLLPLLGDSTQIMNRLGVSEFIYQLLQIMDIEILPYLVFFLVPILGRMSDPNENVRQVVTRCFAQMVKLMPLESSASDPKDLSKTLLEKRESERKFITQLLDPSKLEPYTVPIPMDVQLRQYQKDGINWLAFLNKYQLHGVLSDDMGLGKTLQTICIIAGDHYDRSEKYKQTQQPDCQPLPSLVVCPTSVTGHWLHEIEHYTKGYLRPVIYQGNPNERNKIRNTLNRYNVFIVSYDVLRNDLHDFSNYHFNYCVLDEGHIIKNPKTKLTLAVKQIKANHRLILSGTPVQNHVLELWSLFDFLMPGFLGTEKQFQERYSKPILAMKNAIQSSKSSKTKKDLKKIHEAGTLALETLHKQVLPFLLRRMKEDVLQDLPPKIIQDYYCEMSPLQQFLYQDFIKKQQQEILTNEKNSVHIFQSLNYMRKLVNHPALVLNDQHPLYTEVQTKLQQEQSSLNDLKHAPKFSALQELLLSCGIGQEEQRNYVSPHRALIFCQLKSMLDRIENELFKQHMPSVTYLRLDGGIEPSQRQNIVYQFNSDPSIDCLLLTTNVGGLGLNLTGADTVIFMEHDWNPMKDLQAMDRAHRLGQKRVVNVYRLITKDSLEEKIMGLQRFKLNLANTIINQENTGSGLKQMESDELLSLFEIEKGEKRKSAIEEDGKKRQKFLKEQGLDMVQELNELIEGGDRYEEDLQFDSFLQKLNKK